MNRFSSFAEMIYWMNKTWSNWIQIILNIQRRNDNIFTFSSVNAAHLPRLASMYTYMSISGGSSGGGGGGGVYVSLPSVGWLHFIPHVLSFYPRISFVFLSHSFHLSLILISIMNYMFGNHFPVSQFVCISVSTHSIHTANIRQQQLDDAVPFITATRKRYH